MRKMSAQETAAEVRAEEPGVAKIKPEFLLLDYKPVIDTTFVSDKVKDQLKRTGPDQGNEKTAAEEEPPTKKFKLTGRNKKRPKGKRVQAIEKICPAIVRDQTCSYGDSCKFSHDRKKFMETKLPDISDHCYVFETYGKCPFGLACRFGSKHISEELKNITKENSDEKKLTESVKNVLRKENQVLLWKRKYDFSKANAVIDEMGCRNPREKSDEKNSRKNQAKSANSDQTKNDNVSTEPNKVTSFRGQIQKPNENCKDNSVCVDDDISNSGNIESVTEVTDKSDDSNMSSVTTSKTDTTEVTSSEKGTEKAKDPEILDHTSESNKVKSDEIVTQATKTEISQKEDHIISSPATLSKVSVQNNVQGDVINDVYAEEKEILLGPREKKKVDFADKLYLAPLTTVGNLPFRRICKRFGADITCGEMAVATNLLQGQASEWALLKRHESEDLFGVQICGAYPDTMTRCAQIINDTLEVDFVDINCGCPIDLIFNKGEGSALMGRVSKFGQIVKGMTSVLDVPLTVKLRTGIYSDKNIAHTLVPKLRDWGVALTTLHGRSRVQRYTKTADWDYISECAKLAGPMPLFGNGDVLSFVDANERREQTGVSGLMIARGALIKPWIFTEIKEQRHWDISASERFDILRDYTNYGLEHWGSDQQGVESTRRFLLEWLSFLYRYIPVGLLERIPQKINERPPYYRGRNDLETLLSSPNCGDWIKISEMLLGPVPEGFTFLPKHKANAYK